MNTVLQFENIVRGYKKTENVLNGVSFRMGPGEILGLLGRNGAGKTTLIRIAMGMLYPASGRVSVFGHSPTLDPVAVKSRIGYVAEDQVLPPGATLRELTAFHASLFRNWDAALERELTERFALRPADKIKNLSKGQARQAALICALCHRPELLILDEPAGGLDPAARREFLEASIQLLNREGTAILFSSHHMSDVERLGGRVVLLDGGRVLLDEELDNLRDDVCVALAPSAAGNLKLEALPGYLRSGHAQDGWHGVFRGEPAEVSRRIQTALGSNNIQCSRVPLEELFVEMVGGRQ